MPALIALYDSCVLYPAPLRDLLMHLALTDIYRAKWSNAIHDEWIRSVLKSRPDLKSVQLERTRELMNAHVRDCLVEGYEKLIPSLKLPDPDDRHVLAAAVKASASIIVTYNLKDFPSKILGEYNIEAKHPDIFIANQIDMFPELICMAIKRLRLSLKNPPKTAEEYLNILEHQSLNKAVKKLNEVIDFI